VVRSPNHDLDGLGNDRNRKWFGRVPARRVTTSRHTWRAAIQHRRTDKIHAAPVVVSRSFFKGKMSNAQRRDEPLSGACLHRTLADQTDKQNGLSIYLFSSG
jgi:hypothetical protein